MTKTEAVQRFDTILKDRLELARTRAVANASSNWEKFFPTLQTLLRELPAAAGEPRGACDYQIGSESFCIDNVTRAECEGELGGIFREGETCPTRGAGKITTKAPVVKGFDTILKARLELARTAALASPSLQSAEFFPSLQGVLNALPAASGAPLGACDYQIGSEPPSCIAGVTEAECRDKLSGTFRPGGTCPKPP